LIQLRKISALAIVSGVIGILSAFDLAASNTSTTVCDGDLMRVHAAGTPAATVLDDIQTACGIRFDGLDLEPDRPVVFSQSGKRQDTLRSLLHVLNVKSYALEYRDDILIRVTILPDSLDPNMKRSDPDITVPHSAEKPFADGLRIIAIINGSQADLANLSEGDVILYYDGQRVTKPSDLVRLSQERGTQEGVEMIVIRDGAPIRVFLNGGFIGIRIRSGLIERALLEKYVHIME